MFGPVRYLGVEVEERYLALVELGKAGGGYEVRHAARLALPEGATPREAAQVLAAYLAENNSAAAHIAMSLPASQCALKFAYIPWTKGTEQQRVVQYEAMSQIPLPLTEMVWDYQVSGSSTSPLCHTFIAATRRAPVIEMMEAFTGAARRPAILDISIIAAVRAMADMDYAEEPYLLVHIGDEWADMALALDNHIFAARSFRAGLRDLAHAIAGAGTMTYEYAIEHLATRGIPPDLGVGDGPAEVEAWFDRVGQQIRQMAESVVGESADLRPRRVVLVGGIGLADGCADALSRRCGLPVMIGDPWVGMRVDANCRQVANERPAAFAIATGLALAGLQRAGSINLLPRLYAEVSARRRKDTALLISLTLAVVVLLGICSVTNDSLHSAQVRLRELKVDVTKVRREAHGRVSRPAADAAVVRSTVRAIEEPRRHPLELLRRISADFPRGIALTEFSYQQDKAVILKGSAISSAVIADAVARLNGMKAFDNIRLDFVNVRKDGNKGYDFQMTCAFTASKKTRGRIRQ